MRQSQAPTKCNPDDQMSVWMNEYANEWMNEWRKERALILLSLSASSVTIHNNTTQIKTHHSIITLTNTHASFTKFTELMLYHVSLPLLRTVLILVPLSFSLTPASNRGTPEDHWSLRLLNDGLHRHHWRNKARISRMDSLGSDTQSFSFLFVYTSNPVQ